ncbi:MAG: CDF family Co(II)/Ni(II) efflux transporter DmeF [Gammaproteobacteria bacterium]|jgi:cation diffusion facilitator family transporter
MHHDNLHHWEHTHAFGQDLRRPGEPRTFIVIAITAVMMVVEITTGIIFGSMALLADGLHMASHAVALSINAFAYVYARRNAHSTKYSFGTGKVNALGGFTGAVLLALFALLMAVESVGRFFSPVSIAFDQAILVAIIGLVINGASVFILGHRHDGDAHERHRHDHGHGHHHRHDHNLQSAYFHVLADALTSLLAIFALLAAKYAGLVWMDPLMGIVGAVLVARWSLGLLRTTGAVLLDEQGPEAIRARIRESIEDHDNRVTDLHLWSIGPGIYCVIVSVVTHDPQPPEHYKALIPGNLGLVHVTVEVHPCLDREAGQRTLRSARS